MAVRVRLIAQASTFMKHSHDRPSRSCSCCFDDVVIGGTLNLYTGLVKHTIDKLPFAAYTICHDQTNYYKQARPRLRDCAICAIIFRGHYAQQLTSPGHKPKARFFMKERVDMSEAESSLTKQRNTLAVCMFAPAVSEEMVDTAEMAYLNSYQDYAESTGLVPGSTPEFVTELSTELTSLAEASRSARRLYLPGFIALHDMVSTYLHDDLSKQANELSHSALPRIRTLVLASYVASWRSQPNCRFDAVEPLGLMHRKPLEQDPLTIQIPTEYRQAYLNGLTRTAPTRSMTLA